MFNKEFNEIIGNEIAYYPPHLHEQIDQIHALIYHQANDGIYKTGFSTRQDLYEDQIQDIFACLDYIEGILSTQRYLVGNILTEANWRFCTTLVRFDPVYYTHFKFKIGHILDYPNLRNYVRDLCQTERVCETVNMQHIKEHYYTSHPQLNPSKIISLGPHLDYDAPHDREKLAAP
ncbi:MAG: glutathione S-transferase C-terminal domain-containing protein [Bacteroidota bacterium]